MAYRVIHFFYDLDDSAHAYCVGDSYPRKGITVSDARIKELSSNKNRLGVPVIEAVPAAKKTAKKKGT